VQNWTSRLFYPQKLFAFVFLLNLPKATAFASFGSELNFRSIQARTSPSRGPLVAIFNSMTLKNYGLFK